jgi:bacteriorhodopsin
MNYAQQVVAEVMKPTKTAGCPADPTSTSNPHSVSYQLATEDGNRALWVVFTIMFIASGLFAGLSWNIPVSRRLYHIITSAVVIIAALSYFAMATGDGIKLHCVADRSSHHRGQDSTVAVHETCRQIYWARYVDWTLTTPLLLLDLCLLAGIDGAHTIMAIFADVIMVLTGLFATFGSAGAAQKWGWYAIACAAYVGVIWHVAVHGSRMVTAKGTKVVKLFSTLAAFTLVLWTAYPIVWAVADGSRRASVDTEIMIYAVLDFLAKPVFGLWLLLSHRSVPETNVELGGYWAHGLSDEGRIRIDDGN